MAIAPDLERRASTPLHTIPEATPATRRPAPARTVTPGSNAFAQQAARLDKHRLASNAFYQQEMARRNVTPPTVAHPALREDFDLEKSVSQSPPTIIRDSGLTTMSPFMKDGGKTPLTPPSLVPEDSMQAYPTDRGFIEDKREKRLHENSDSDFERTPVYTYTPKISSSEFSKSMSHATPKKKKGVDWTSVAEMTRSPGKGFLQKLRITTSRSPQATASTISLGTARGYGGGGPLPPKARAVLGNAPQKGNLGRSPSKKSSLFSRKTAEQPSHETPPSAPTFALIEPRSASALTVTFSDSTGKTPQTSHTAFSDPTYDRHGHSKRAVSQTHSEQGGRVQHENHEGGNACGISRSKSLQYADRKPPPTPPAKDTPPHEKKLQAQQETDRILADIKLKSDEKRQEFLKEMTPEFEMTQTSSSKLKFPLYNRIFEDDTPVHEKAKLMGADGRTSPTKSGGYAHKNVAQLVKQPSVYSLHASFYADLGDQYSAQEVKKCVDGLGLEGLSELPEDFYNTKPKVQYSPSIYDDDMDMDPSSTIRKPLGLLRQAGMDVRSSSRPAVAENDVPRPLKASLQAKRSDSSTSNGTIQCMYPDLASDPSRTDPKSPFYKSTANDLTLLDKDVPVSPPDYRHPSAVPSPLQFLPTTTYKSSRNAKAGPSPMSPSSTKTLTPSRSRQRIETFKATGSPLARQSENPFDKLPTLPQPLKTSFDLTASTAVRETQPKPVTHNHGSSPIKQPPQQTAVTSGDSERMQVILRRMETQQDEIMALRAELQAMSARLGAPMTPSASSFADSDVGHVGSDHIEKDTMREVSDLLAVLAQKFKEVQEKK